MLLAVDLGSVGFPDSSVSENFGIFGADHPNAGLFTASPFQRVCGSALKEIAINLRPPRPKTSAGKDPSLGDIEGSRQRLDD